MDGILLIDKPEGLTSAGVVREVKAALRCKVGHLGTLDPFASGLLPLVLNEGTKIAQFLNTADKAYEGVIRLGARTDSGDRTGTVVEEKPLPGELTQERCDEVATVFLGDRMQIPPMYSAVKKDGVPLYKMARKGIEIEREPRPVRIHSLGLSPLGRERIAIRIHCSKGTYVRVLSEEIGAALGTVAHLENLRRTRFGRFRLEAAIALPVSPGAASEALISPRDALAELEELRVDSSIAAQVRRGLVAALSHLDRPRGSDLTMKLVGPDGSLLAVVAADDLGRWQFARVMGA